MKFFLISLMLITSSINAVAATVEGEQNRLYLNCLIKSKVDPRLVSKEQELFCLVEAGVVDPGDDERKKATDLWRRCLLKKAAELDDGNSPVADISKAILPHCVNQWKGYVSSFYMYPEAKTQMSSDISKYALNEGVQATLLVRKAKKEISFKK